MLARFSAPSSEITTSALINSISSLSWFFRSSGAARISAYTTSEIITMYSCDCSNSKNSLVKVLPDLSVSSAKFQTEVSI